MPLHALAQAGLDRAATFTDYAPQVESRELLRRTVTPMAYAQIDATLAHLGKSLPPQSVDLVNERFMVYVPAGPPPAKGYGLLVFVPPWDDARLPDGWSSALDEHHVIFVSALGSGNGQSIVDRREPLALLAEANIARRYPVDASRIYIGGFSGGSRIAMRLALAYPDVFSGAFLNSGSDPIATAAIPLPPADLFHRFQENTRLYYATGADDLMNLGQDGVSARAMRDVCVFNIEKRTMSDMAHEPAGGGVLSDGLSYLDEAPAADAGALASCRDSLAKDMQEKVQRIRSDIAAGNRGDAQKELVDLNNRYGGLAAPDIAALSTVP
jgi:pimeloyl-ACP methyl ester carboxylesterase